MWLRRRKSPAPPVEAAPGPWSGLVAAVASPDPEVRRGALSRLAALDGRGWLELDDGARGDLGWACYWSAPDVAGAPPLAAVAVSMHPDGRLRQRAVGLLAALPGPLPAAALALRCADHVAEIRSDALAALRGRPAVPLVAEVLCAASGRPRGRIARLAYGDHLLTLPDASGLFEGLRASEDPAVRRWAFERSWDLMTPAQLRAAASAGPDQLVRFGAVERLAGRAGPAELRALLTGGYVGGRIVALERLADADLPDDRIRDALLDRSARVRRIAHWRARRRGLDSAEVYRRHLTGPRTAAALAGLAAAGTAADLPRVLPTLRSLLPSVRAAAATATAALAPSDQVPALITPLLLDPSPRVTAAAATALVRAGAPAGAEGAAWSSPQLWSRRAAWRLTRARGGWDRLEADLRAAADQDRTLEELGRAGLGAWLARDAATVWEALDDDRRRTLLGLLGCSPLDPARRAALSFHIGPARSVSH